MENENEETESFDWFGQTEAPKFWGNEEQE